MRMDPEEFQLQAHLGAEVKMGSGLIKQGDSCAPYAFELVNLYRSMPESAVLLRAERRRLAQALRRTQ